MKITIRRRHQTCLCVALLGVSLLGGCESQGRDTAASNAAFDDAFLRDEPKKYSQNREEVVIRHFFQDRRGGVFLDVGSAEWKDNSTTYYLEEELGWTGIAIDARAELAPTYAKNRPATKFFSYLVSDHSGTPETFYSAGYLSSGNEHHLDQFELDKSVRPVVTKVATITLNDLLSREKVDHVDFLSMDIEGFEPQALAGFDIGKYAPGLVCIEKAPQTREAIQKFFAEHGYRQVAEYIPYDDVNWYFVKAGPATPTE